MRVMDMRNHMAGLEGPRGASASCAAGRVRKLRAGDHPLLVDVGIEKAVGVRDRPGQPLTFLHDCSDLLAIGARSQYREWNAVNENLAQGRLEKAKHNLDQGRVSGR